ncbi:Uncharacterized protein YPO0702 [Desulfuromusa kysingii]|uniref:Uncharacterized protein YPO0702 n=1 Tax=Desulfuromusa kysingii TaxID=37625 RepID=A0A1H4ED49_9BACT|nr:MliC family protein [Desulfuromusa kysingii]SEA82975.1 Uncharacterized protein YPO0702 [Desulfuromusa kysingii]
MMKLKVMVLIFFLAGCAHVGNVQQTDIESISLCSDAWYEEIEAKVHTGDNHGHGPDIGSEEWKSTIEFRLGIRGQNHLPDRHSHAWCQYIDQLVKQTPRKHGDNPTNDAIEAIVRVDPELSELDRMLDAVYSLALRVAPEGHSQTVSAEQQRWISNRNDCWNAENKRSCLYTEYKRRIAELQAKYRLIADSGSFHFICTDDPVNQITVNFFQTDPPTLILEKTGTQTVMYLQPSASGAKYQSRENLIFWEHHGEILLVDDSKGIMLRCQKGK